LLNFLFQRKSKSKLTTKNINQLDEDTRKLQEKADMLLEKAYVIDWWHLSIFYKKSFSLHCSESSVGSSEPIVSTVGLGSEDRNSTVGSGSVMDEACYRPNFTRWSALG
jgi:hypothetical protein